MNHGQSPEGWNGPHRVGWSSCDKLAFAKGTVCDYEKKLRSRRHSVTIASRNIHGVAAGMLVEEAN